MPNLEEQLKTPLEKPLQSLAILLLEDMAEVRKATKKLIVFYGGEVRETATEEEFFDAYRAKVPDVMLIDNKNERGEERAIPIAEKLVSQFSAPWRSIIVYSGDFDSALPDYVMQRGAQFLAKPYTNLQLVAAIKHAANR